MQKTDSGSSGPLHTQAKERAFREAYLNRSIPFLSEACLPLLKEKRVAIAGCGGVGGVVAVTLARMGIQHFHLADPGRFDLPDLNRQWAATTKTLGRNKAQVYREILLDINPYADVRIWEEGLQPQNLAPFLDETDVVLDCLDLSVPLSLRADLFELAHRQGIFSLTAPILGFGGMLICSDPAGNSMNLFLEILENVQKTGTLPEVLYEYLTPEHLDLISQWLIEKRTRVPSIGVAPLVVGSLAATETLAALVGSRLPGGRKPIALPEVVTIDLFKMKYSVVNLERVMQAQEV